MSIATQGVKGFTGRPALERFTEKYTPEPNSGCWLWVGEVNKHGYSRFMDESGHKVSAHRWAYMTFVGPIPAAKPHLDHLCRVRCCVNPAHLEPVTNLENMMRGDGPALLSKRLLARTHCSNGHEYTPDNVTIRYRPDGRPYKRCITCNRENYAAYLVRTPRGQRKRTST